MSKQVGGEHYQLPIEPITYILANEIPYREGNVIKYVTRHRAKDGRKDIEKAIHYLEMILEDYNEKDKQKSKTEERDYQPDRTQWGEVLHEGGDLR